MRGQYLDELPHTTAARIASAALAPPTDSQRSRSNSDVGLGFSSSPRTSPTAGPKLCVNGCGRHAANGFSTCCRTCSGPYSNHGPQCEARAVQDSQSVLASLPQVSLAPPAGRASPTAAPSLCENGCGRLVASGFATCCRTCSGPSTDHGPQCEARFRASQERDIATTRESSEVRGKPKRRSRKSLLAPDLDEHEDAGPRARTQRRSVSPFASPKKPDGERTLPRPERSVSPFSSPKQSTSEALGTPTRARESRIRSASPFAPQAGQPVDRSPERGDDVAAHTFIEQDTPDDDDVAARLSQEARAHKKHKKRKSSIKTDRLSARVDADSIDVDSGPREDFRLPPPVLDVPRARDRIPSLDLTAAIAARDAAHASELRQEIVPRRENSLILDDSLDDDLLSPAGNPDVRGPSPIMTNSSLRSIPGPILAGSSPMANRSLMSFQETETLRQSTLQENPALRADSLVIQTRVESQSSQSSRKRFRFRRPSLSFLDPGRADPEIVMFVGVVVCLLTGMSITVIALALQPQGAY